MIISALLILLLATGCTTSVSGHGLGALDSAVAPPKSSAVAAPNTVAPTPTAIGSPAYRRTVTTTAIGDPVTADLCAGLIMHDFPDPTVEYRDQPMGGCQLYANAPDGDYNLFVEAARPQEIYLPSGGTRTTQSGIDVLSFAVRKSDCVRAILVPAVTLVIDTTVGDAPIPTDTELCAAADQLTKQLVVDVVDNVMPRVSIASHTITNLAPCPALSATAAAKILGVSKVSVEPRNFDSGCNWLAAGGDELSATMWSYDSRDATIGTAVSAGDHQLRQVNDGSDGYCIVAFVQGDPGNYLEAFQFEADSASTTTPAATTCGQATQLAVALLGSFELT